MVPAPCGSTAPVPPPAYQRALVTHRAGLHLAALTVVETLHLLTLCRLTVRLARPDCPAVLPKGPGGVARVYSHASLLLIELLRTLWRLSLRDMHDWPALAAACGLPADAQGRRQTPSPGTTSKRAATAGAPPYEVLFVEAIRQGLRARLIGARDLIIDSAPITAWRRADLDARYGHAPAHHPTAFLQGFRLHTLLCRGSGLPGTRARVSFRLAPPTAMTPPSPARCWPWPFAWTPPTGAAYWGPALIARIHITLHATAVIPWNPTRIKNRPCLPPTWTRAELGKRTSMGYPLGPFFGCIMPFFRLQRPPLVGWTAVTQQVALTYTASTVVGLAAQHVGRRTPRLRPLP